jgi:protein involved in polysaccharide export with SLBB domain
VLRRILVNGDVVRPGVYFVDVRHQLRDVLILAGGVSGIGSRDKVFIVRASEKIRVRNWEHDTSERADLQSGDQIIVGRRNWFANNAMTAVSIAGLLTTIGFTLLR